MSASDIVYLVSGANRGLGLGFVSQILAKHQNGFVYAGARDPEGAHALRDLEVKYPGRLAIVKLDSADVESNRAAASLIEARHGRLDTVIANAGIAHAKAVVAEVSPADLDEHFHVNVTGTIVLFQAVQHLLRKSASPRFVPISSSAGRLTGPVIEGAFRNVAYSASKAALNCLFVSHTHTQLRSRYVLGLLTRICVRRHSSFVSFSCYKSDVTGLYVVNYTVRHSAAKDTTGAFEQLLAVVGSFPSPEEGALVVLSVVDASTRENHGGLFYNQRGERLEW